MILMSYPHRLTFLWAQLDMKAVFIGAVCRSLELSGVSCFGRFPHGCNLPWHVIDSLSCCRGGPRPNIQFLSCPIWGVAKTLGTTVTKWVRYLFICMKGTCFQPSTYPLVFQCLGRTQCLMMSDGQIIRKPMSLQILDPNQ